MTSQDGDSTDEYIDKIDMERFEEFLIDSAGQDNYKLLLQILSVNYPNIPVILGSFLSVLSEKLEISSEDVVQLVLEESKNHSSDGSDKFIRLILVAYSKFFSPYEEIKKILNVSFEKGLFQGGNPSKIVARFDNFIFVKTCIQLGKEDTYKQFFCDEFLSIKDDMDRMVDIFTTYDSEQAIHNFKKYSSKNSDNENATLKGISIMPLLLNVYRKTVSAFEEMQPILPFVDKNDKNNFIKHLQEVVSKYFSKSYVPQLFFSGLTDDFYWNDISERKKILFLADLLEVVLPDRFEPFEEWCKIHKTSGPSAYDKERIRQANKLISRK